MNKIPEGTLPYEPFLTTSEKITDVKDQIAQKQKEIADLEKQLKVLAMQKESPDGLVRLQIRNSTAAAYKVTITTDKEPVKACKEVYRTDDLSAAAQYLNDLSIAAANVCQQIREEIEAADAEFDRLIQEAVRPEDPAGEKQPSDAE